MHIEQYRREQFSLSHSKLHDHRNAWCWNRSSNRKTKKFDENGLKTEKDQKQLNFKITAMIYNANNVE